MMITVTVMASGRNYHELHFVLIVTFNLPLSQIDFCICHCSFDRNPGQIDDFRRGSMFKNFTDLNISGHRLTYFLYKRVSRCNSGFISTVDNPSICFKYVTVHYVSRSVVVPV